MDQTFPKSLIDLFDCWLTTNGVHTCKKLVRGEKNPSGKYNQYTNLNLPQDRQNPLVVEQGCLNIQAMMMNERLSNDNNYYNGNMFLLSVISE